MNEINKPVNENFSGISPYLQRMDNRHIAGMLNATIAGMVSYFHPELIKEALKSTLEDELLWNIYLQQHKSNRRFREWEEGK